MSDYRGCLIRQGWITAGPLYYKKLINIDVIKAKICEDVRNSFLPILLKGLI